MRSSIEVTVLMAPERLSRSRYSGRLPGMRRLLGTAVSALLTLPLLATPAEAAAPDWDVAVVDPDQSFRGLDAVDRDTAWVSGGSLTEGGAGRVYRTTDGGETWDDVTPPGTEGLSLRDVEARDANTAVVLSIGPGEESRIWRTTDGGATWTETFRNDDDAAFYNCLDFYPDGRHGLAVSDPVDGKFRIAATTDGGATWEVLPDAGMPSSDGEYNFSASGDCLVVSGRTAWFGSGGEQARVFRSTDHGMTWSASDSTLRAGEAAGVFGLAAQRPHHVVAVGGDFDPAVTEPDGSAYSRNGRSWRSGGDLAHLGEDVAWATKKLLVVVGESGPEAGSSWSRDGGRTWQEFSTTGFHTLDCVRGGCWAAGGGGRVGVL
jgi:photosystem II stability/assembly factor-like uncharacterized protein